VNTTNGIFSALSDEWRTPESIFKALKKEFPFTLDPCSDGQNAKVGRYFTRAENGLLRSWKGETVFLNPPYSEIKKWMAKAYGAARDEGAIVVCLVPSRTDTDWWHSYALRGEIRFIRGRIRFSDTESNAPFPSAVIIFRPTEFALKSF